MFAAGFAVQPLDAQQPQAVLDGMLFPAVASVHLAVLAVVDNPGKAGLGPGKGFVLAELVPGDVVKYAQEWWGLFDRCRFVQNLFEGVAGRLQGVFVRPASKCLGFERAISSDGFYGIHFFSSYKIMMGLAAAWRRRAPRLDRSVRYGDFRRNSASVPCIPGCDPDRTVPPLTRLRGWWPWPRPRPMEQ